MKNKIICLIAFLIALVLVPIPTAQAQTATYSTTTTTTINATQLCFVVASTTNMHASGDITGPNNTPQEWDAWFDGEFVKINSVNTTSKQICVTRGKSPTRGGIHATTVPLWFGPAGLSPFINSAPLTTSPGPVMNSGQFGSCVRTNFAFLPLVNVANGSLWDCTGSRWLTYGLAQFQQAHNRTAIVNADYTALFTDEIIAYTSLSAAHTLTLPSPTGFQGKVYIVKDELGITSVYTIWITAGGTNKINGSTASQTGYASAGFFALRLYSNGTDWFTW